MPYFSFIWLCGHCIEWLIYCIFLLHPVCCSDWFSWVQAIAMMQRTITSILTLAPSHLCSSWQCSGQLRQLCSPSPLKGPCSWENMLLEHVRHIIWPSYAMPYYAILCCAILCHAILCNTILCHAMSCHAMLEKTWEYHKNAFYVNSLCTLRLRIVWICHCFIVINSSIRRSRCNIFLDKDYVRATGNIGADACPVHNVLQHDRSTGSSSPLN